MDSEIFEPVGDHAGLSRFWTRTESLVLVKAKAHMQFILWLATIVLQSMFNCLNNVI